MKKSIISMWLENQHTPLRKENTSNQATQPNEAIAHPSQKAKKMLLH
jgi:hypothetical protein